jgi:hypothetical protein
MTHTRERSRKACYKAEHKSDTTHKDRGGASGIAKTIYVIGSDNYKIRKGSEQKDEKKKKKSDECTDAA